MIQHSTNNMHSRAQACGLLLIFVRIWVLHSQSLSEKPLQPWVIIQKDGTVESAHCNCMAGLGESCTHVAATLFALDAAVKHRNTKTVTEDKAYWLPAASKKVPFSEVRFMDFRSAKKRKSDLDQGHTHDLHTDKLVPGKKDLGSKPSEKEKEELLQQIYQAEPQAAVLTVAKKYCKNFAPKYTELPPRMSSLRSTIYNTLTFSELLTKCEDVFHNLPSITATMVQNVEQITRNQSESSDWFTHRAGRVTASKMKAACSTDPANPSVSLIKTICYPTESKFSTAATRWGVEHEKVARDEYCDAVKHSHEEFQIKESGLHLHAAYPHLGASPDGIVSCCCCGHGVCEIKCPYNMRQADLCSDELPKDFCLKRQNGQLSLNKTHSYFYQVQAQLFICKAEFCDLITWTTKSLVICRIEPDEEFWASIQPNLQNFFCRGILPELLINWYTTRVLTPVQLNTKMSSLYPSRAPATMHDNGRRCTLKFCGKYCLYWRRYIINV